MGQYSHVFRMAGTSLAIIHQQKLKSGLSAHIQMKSSNHPSRTAFQQSWRGGDGVEVRRDGAALTWLAIFLEKGDA